MNKSRRTAYTEGEVLDAEDRLICKGTGTFMLTETMTQKEREGPSLSPPVAERP